MLFPEISKTLFYTTDLFFTEISMISPSREELVFVNKFKLTELLISGKLILFRSLSFTLVWPGLTRSFVMVVED